MASLVSKYYYKHRTVLEGTLGDPIYGPIDMPEYCKGVFEGKPRLEVRRLQRFGVLTAKVLCLMYQGSPMAK